MTSFVYSSVMRYRFIKYFLLIFQTQALALTRPKSPVSNMKEDQKQALHHLLHVPLSSQQHHSPQLSPIQPISLAASSSSNERSDSDEPRGPTDNTSQQSPCHNRSTSKPTPTDQSHSNSGYTAQQAAVALEFARQNQALAADTSAAAALYHHHNHNSHNHTNNNNNNNNNLSSMAVNLKVMRSSRSSSPVAAAENVRNTAGGSASSQYLSNIETPQTPPSSDRRDLNLSNMNGE